MLPLLLSLWLLGHIDVDVVAKHRLLHAHDSTTSDLVLKNVFSWTWCSRCCCHSLLTFAVATVAICSCHGCTANVASVIAAIVLLVIVLAILVVDLVVVCCGYRRHRVFFHVFIGAVVAAGFVAAVVLCRHCLTLLNVSGVV